MTGLNIKQIGTSGANLGASLVHDGTRLQFSNNITGALLLPIGGTAARPGTSVNGMLRYNSDTSQLEVYQGNTWTNVVGGASSGPSRYIVTLQYSGTGLVTGNPPAGAILPPGWSVNVTSSTAFTITHNLGKYPVALSFGGWTTVGGTGRALRTFSATTTNVTYPDTNTMSVTSFGSSTVMGAANGASQDIYLTI